MADRADSAGEGEVHHDSAPRAAWQSRSDAASRPWTSRADRGQLLKPVMKGDVMLVEGVALRECVLTYTAPDGSTFRELVPLQTIVDSAGGIAHLPLTLQHPDADVTDENVGELAVGNVGADVRVEDDGFTFVHLAIRKKAAKDAVRNGTHELSLKYDARVDPTPGVHPKYGPYDGIQVERSKYNHLALVDQARVGPDARIRADGVATTTLRADAAPQNTPASKAKGAAVNPGFIAVLSLLGVTRRIDSDDAAIAAIDVALRARKDAEEAAAAKAEEEEEVVEAEQADAKKKFDELQAAYDAMKAEYDALKASAAKDAEKADCAALAPLALALKVDAAAHPSPKALRKAIATAHLGGKLRADASDVYIDAVVDLAQAAHTQRGDGRESGRQAWEQPQNGQGQQDPPARQDGEPRLSPIQKVKAAQKAARAGGAK